MKVMEPFSDSALMNREQGGIDLWRNDRHRHDHPTLVEATTRSCK